MPTSKPRGRQFFANPGPTNIPDSVLRAMDRPSVDFNDPDFVEVYDEAFAGVKRVLRTTQHLFMYNASGHGAWEASLTNLLSPGRHDPGAGNRVLLRGMGQDGHRPRAERPHRGGRPPLGVDIAALRAALAADTAGEIKAVCVVHNETATGMMLPVDEIRAAIDATGPSGAVPGRYDFVARIARFSHGRVEDRLRRRRQPEGPDAAHRHELHRRVRQGHGSACARRTEAASISIGR